MSKFNNFRNYNPDILETIANLSNDEVFTPPKLANEILDLLPEEVWSDSTITFLDPAVKTGIFLREIASRLIDGLAEEIPDLQERVNHILTKQVFGIGITELTTLMARRTVYCSMYANGPYSICTEFDDEKGNIIFPDTEHTWDKNGRCEYCGANSDNYGGGTNRENYAYPFIHDNFEKEFGNMKFDVIIGNPPYQLEDGGGGGGSSTPLYDKFVEKALSLDPSYVTMIIPARWYIGGKGLNNFRKMMLNNKNLKEIHDYENPFELFKNMGIAGGICYFLIDKQYNDENVNVFNYNNNLIVNSSLRKLEYRNSSLFIRNNLAVNILEKVDNVEENGSRLDSSVLARMPFGIGSNFNDYSKEKSEKYYIKLYRFGDNGYIDKSKITQSKEIVGKYKVLTSKARGVVVNGPNLVISSPFIALPNEVCTETYLVIKSFDNIEEAKNLVSYMKTKFFRYMVSVAKITQNMTKSTYQFVPLQDWSKPWTDEELYKKYKLTQEEIDYIEETIEPMD